jgi:LAO/AO transport system kinase
MNDIAKKVLSGDQRAIARLITLAENNDPAATKVMADIHPHTGNAHIIGITGVMGSGKSTLICELTRIFRKQRKKVGIIAIDPTSPFSGGALLGDRVRILDASGKDVIMVETVGVGQAEVDVIKIADTTLVIIVPGLGDSIQTLKAGVMEIADIYVVNKADRQGVQQAVAEIESLVDISCSEKDRKTPIMQTISKDGKGIEELVKEIINHFKYLEKTKEIEAQRRIRYEAELIEIIKKSLMNFIFDESKLKNTVEKKLDQISRKEVDPYTAANEILGKILK